MDDESGDVQAQRTCPVCGEQTEARFCPHDRAKTVFTSGYLKPPRLYRFNDVVGDRYRILEKIAEGGFAVVFRAEHVGTGQHVALKLLSIDPGSDDWLVGLRRFFREARVTAGLTHPNTVRVFDVGQDVEGALFLTMEYLLGETLEQILRRRVRAGLQLQEEEILAIAIPILESLEEAHSCGLVHRDLKPGNIMISTCSDGTQQVKVLDFGIARTAGSSLTAVGYIPGTPPFMSPEQCLGQEVDLRSDLYSLAALLYLCATGRALFSFSESLDIMRAHVMNVPEDPRDLVDNPLSDGFVKVLLETLAKRPEDRPQTAGELAARLRAIRPHEEPAPSIPPPPVSPPPMSPRHRDSGLVDPKSEVEVLLKMAAQTTDPYRQLQYLRHALELEPRNLKVRERERMARRLMGDARRRFGTGRPNKALVDISRGPKKKR